MKWKIEKLGKVCDVIAGQSPPSSTYNTSGNGMPFFQGKADFGIVHPVARYWCTEPTKVSQPNDILLSVRAPVGPTNLCDIESCIGRGLAAIRSTGKTDPKFVLYYFKSIEKDLSTKGNGSTFSAITTSDVKDLQIPLPPLPIQQKIAAILDEADALRRKDKALLAKYDDLLQAVFYDMFGDPVKNEKGWEVRKIKEVCENIVDCVNRTAPISESVTPFKMIRTTNVRGYKINLDNVNYVSKDVYDKWVRRLQPRIDDIIFTREAPVGEAGLIETNDAVFLGQRTMLYRPQKNLISPKFLLFQIMGAGIQTQINKIGSGSTVKHLSVPECKEFDVLVPPIDLQNEFEQIVSNIFDQKNKISQAHSENLFQSLMQRAFKGELV